MMDVENRLQPESEARPMTAPARRFLQANAQSPVVYGSVIGDGGRGVMYRLADGTVWKLTRQDCLHVRQPRWAMFEAA
jgi:hypothetical protein